MTTMTIANAVGERRTLVCAAGLGDVQPGDFVRITVSIGGFAVAENVLPVVRVPGARWWRNALAWWRFVALARIWSWNPCNA